MDSSSYALDAQTYPDSTDVFDGSDSPVTSDATAGTGICCTGTVCSSVLVTSCPTNASDPTLFIPTESDANRPTVSDGCVSLGDAFAAASTGNCETATFAGMVDDGSATMCFPGYTPGLAFQIVQCEDNGLAVPPPNCPGAYSIPHMDQGTNHHFCCSYPEQSPDDSLTQLCAFNLTGLGTFGFGVLVDTDSDGTPDILDNCPTTWNPTQADKDHDSIGDVCDNCPYTYNQDQAAAPDSGVGNACNCALSPPPFLGQDGCPCSDGGGPLVDGGSACGLIVLEDGGLADGS